MTEVVSPGPEEVNQLNLQRKNGLIDLEVARNQDGVPLPSWVELSVVDLCNRTCEFCPRSDPEIAPNRKHYMTLELCERLAEQLKAIEFSGTIVLGGYGEPLLHPQVNQIIETFSRVSNTEVVTNGDRLGVKIAQDLVRHGAAKTLVSLYDGPEQLEKFNDVLTSAKIPLNRFLLRPRWHTAGDDFGLILTNRAGTVSVGNQPELREREKCFYPHYMMMIDWNGDVFPCPQDWHRKNPVGNVDHQSLMDVWLAPKYQDFRERLAQADRGLFPCNQCNARGVLHGENHAHAWERYYRRD